MICQKCGTDIPEDKIYCEKCGNAIQMVPDYNPNEDFTVGTEEKEQQSVPEEAFTASDSWWYRRRYWLAGIGLLILGILAYQISFHYVFHPEETATEPEEVELPAKPEFGIQPGIYSYSPQLTISHREKNNGEIYYTTDGTTPDEQSTLYKAPIFVGMPGGSYDNAFSVTITAEEGCRIYYTTNGEEPGFQSRLYRGPVSIPEGLTVLQAVSVDEDGGMSGIVEAVYDVSGGRRSPTP